MKKGFLIAVEGIDGSGKSVIASELVTFLTDLGYEAILLKEPSDSVYGQRIRNAIKRLSPEEELELFLLDREIDVKERILPALEKGKIVVMDRYYYSNIAYQSARGIEAEKIRELNERIAPKPNLVIILDVSPETALKRIQARGKFTVFEDKEYLKKVRENFIKYAEKNAVIIDAEKPLEDVKMKIFKIVKDLLSSYYSGRC
ncbi:MAG: dTMP kinase [Archaeoglobaceae archaeon]|nr:dTMP kinase [Archaeoglobaceae archaeon]